MSIQAFTFTSVSSRSTPDIKMVYDSPIVSGRTLLKAMRAAYREKQFYRPSIAINGVHHDAEEIRYECIKSGAASAREAASAYLAKRAS